MNGGQFDASGLLGRSVGDVDQFVGQTLILPAALPGEHDDAVALYRVQDVVFNFRGDKKRLDRDSVSLQTLETIAAHDDWRQGEPVVSR